MSRTTHRSNALAIVAGYVLLIIVVFIIDFSGIADWAGVNIPTDDIRRDYLLGALWAIVLGALIAASPVHADDKENLLLAWLAKCWVALVLMLPYEQHFVMDCFSYFYSMRWPEWLGWYWDENLRSRLLVADLGWFQERFIDSFHAVKMTFAMIGLLAIYLIYRAAIAVLGREDRRTLLYLAFFPSIVFWSSIIGKDPIVFFGVALYVYGVAKWRATRLPQYLLILAAGMAVATIMRVWLGIILGLPLLFFMIRGVRGFVPRLVSIAVAAALAIVMARQFSSGMNVASADDLVSVTEKVSHQFSSTRTGASGSTRSVGMDFTSIPSMIAFMPIGTFSVLFRPLPGEVMNIFGFVSGLENCLLLYLFISAMHSMIFLRAVRKPLLRDPVIIWASLLVITWCWSYGFISVQNLGASVRFRLPIIAVFVSLLLAQRWVAAKVREQAQQSAKREAVPMLPPATQNAGA